MNVTELKKLAADASFAEHLNACYLKCKEEHTGSKMSWVGTQWRKVRGGDANTTLNAAGQVTTAVGVTTGMITLTAAETAAGVALSAAAAAITLYAIPAIIAAAAIAKWSYDKTKHRAVNKEIRDWWDAQQREGTLPATAPDLDFETAKKWIGWFGDEGISNMEQLGAKTVEAKKAFDEHFRALEGRADTLLSKAEKVCFRSGANVYGRPIDPSDPKKATKEATRKNEIHQYCQEWDKLAGEYDKLGKDLQYMQYRGERYVMYPQLLAHAIKSWLLKADLPKHWRETKEHVETDTAAYRKLLVTKLLMVTLPSGSVPPLVAPPLPPRGVRQRP